MPYSPSDIAPLNVGTYGEWLSEFVSLTGGWFAIAVLAGVWITLFTGMKANRISTQDAVAASNFVIAMVALIMFPMNLISIWILELVWSVLALSVLWIWLSGD